jgi:hypothetical protein
MFARRHNKFLNIVGRTVLIVAGADLIISRKAINCDSPFVVVTKTARIKSGENDQQMFDDFVKNLNQGHYKKKPYVVFDTATHRAIFKLLDARSRALSADSFDGRDGGPCSLLQGAKGIGKSEMLMAFKEYCKTKYPNIIAVYVSYSDINSDESLLNNHTVLDIVEKELKSVQIATAPASTDGVLKQTDGREKSSFFLFG